MSAPCAASRWCRPKPARTQWRSTGSATRSMRSCPNRIAPPSLPMVPDGARTRTRDHPMYRNIRTLFNFEPPASEDEVRASALQFVRKLSGFAHPSNANEAAFSRAVEEVTEAAHRLLDALETASPPRDREAEAMKARARARERFAS